MLPPSPLREGKSSAFFWGIEEGGCSDPCLHHRLPGPGQGTPPPPTSLKPSDQTRNPRAVPFQVAARRFPLSKQAGEIFLFSLTSSFTSLMCVHGAGLYLPRSTAYTVEAGACPYFTRHTSIQSLKEGGMSSVTSGEDCPEGGTEWLSQPFTPWPPLSLWLHHLIFFPLPPLPSPCLPMTSL